MKVEMLIDLLHIEHPRIVVLMCEMVGGRIVGPSWMEPAAPFHAECARSPLGWVLMRSFFTQNREVWCYDDHDHYVDSWENKGQLSYECKICKRVLRSDAPSKEELESLRG